jgi:hypothetical protein
MPRGRPAGSVSYIGVKLSDLNSILKPDAIVLVDKRYEYLINANDMTTKKVEPENVEETIEASAPIEFVVK